MKRHVLDKPKSRDDSIRTREFLRLAREDGLHPASRELHKRPHEARGLQKVQAYLRIERGQSA
jgi:hypothetical protein